MPKKGSKIDGKHGIYVLNEELGHGGNGIIYDVSVDNRKDNSICEGQEVVVKILTLSNIQNDKEKKKRRERFQREVKAVSQIIDPDLDVLPIIDSYMDVDNYSYEWYAMPKAKEYWLSRSGEELKKLKELRRMGDTLLKLHKIGVYHRDIKPANLLYYKNRCFITDFGLVWNVEEDKHITGEHEALGPVGIRPPEMENHVEKLNVEIDYQKVDAYLYVKTIWIILTGNRNGFRGEYSRSDRMIYMDKDQLNLGKSLEPLHKMMEEATRHNNFERITVDKCLEYIDQQITIAENILPDNILSSFIYDENVSEIRSQIAPDAIIFTKSETIKVALSRMVNTVEVVGEEFGENVSLGLLCRIDSFDTDMFVLSLRTNFALKGKKMRRLYVRITQMHINNDNLCEIKIDKYSSNIDAGSIITNFRDYYINTDSDIGLNVRSNIFLKRIGSQ